MKKCINGLLRAKHLSINYFFIVNYCLSSKKKYIVSLCLLLLIKSPNMLAQLL